MTLMYGIGPTVTLAMWIHRIQVREGGF